jgi:hypothetical protein
MKVNLHLMKMHFFTRNELMNLFEKFNTISIDMIEKTSKNGKYEDSNFIVQLLK